MPRISRPTLAWTFLTLAIALLLLGITYNSWWPVLLVKPILVYVAFMAWKN